MRCAPVLLALLVLAGCRGEAPAEAENRAKPVSAAKAVRVVVIASEALARTVVSTGTLAADDQAIVGTKVAGRLARMLVDLGTPVRRGQEIARIDQVDYAMRVAQAEAGLQQARARLGLSPSGGDDGVDPEQTSVVRQARAVLDEARLTRERSQRLLQQQLIARSQLDAAESNFGVAEGRYQDALEEVRNRQALLVQRRSEHDLARQALADTVIVSPTDGAVSQKMASIGEYLSPGSPVATIIRIHPLRLRVAVPEREAVDVRPGQEARLTVDGDSTVYRGRVVRLSPLVQQDNRTLLIEADIPNERGLLKAGAFAHAEIVTTTSQPVILVDADALLTFAGVEKVLLVRDGRAVESRVQTGPRHGGRVEIVAGLRPGDQVILQPAKLTAGQAVTVTP